MNFQIETTSHPHILKFSSKELLFSETQEFTKDSQSTIPVVIQLLSFPFVKNVLLSGNFVAIEKENTIDWTHVQDELLSLLTENASQLSTPKKIPVNVYAEMTPNPNVMKFGSNVLLYDGIAEVKSNAESTHVPIAEALYSAFDFVEEVFITENYLSITKNAQSDWNDHIMEIREFVWNYIRDGKEIVSNSYVSHTPNLAYTIPEEKDLSDIERKIKDILEEYVKPAVANDGGNIELIAFDRETKTAKMLLQGACSGCPSSTVTLKNGIERMLKDMLPNEIEHVEAVNG